MSPFYCSREKPVADALEILNLVKKYDSLIAVNDVTFNVKPGEIFGLLGPNGAGKTSLISTIVTVEKPTSGSVKIFGTDVSVQPRVTKSMTGIVPQEIVNHGFFNIEEILTFHSGYFGIRNNKTQIHFLLHKLGLFEHRHKRVKQLSGGMKRRLLIAKALVHQPKLLILDEPTAGVDIELRQSLWEFVTELRKSGVTILLTTHYLEEAEQLCDRVGIIHQGRLRRVGPTKELIDEFTQRNINLVLSKTTGSLTNKYLTHQDQNKVSFQIPSTMKVGELLAQTQLNVSDIVDLQINEGSLEDAFRRVLGGVE